MYEGIKSLYNTLLFNGGVLLFPVSPGTLAWKLYKNRKGKVPLIGRDLICDTQTLMSLPKSESSLDEFTTDFSPFIALITLAGQPWKSRRIILSAGLRKINLDQEIAFDLPVKKGDIYWDVFKSLFKIGFKLIFGREATPSEFSDMYPGIADINRLIKKQTGKSNLELRWRLYHRVAKLLSDENPQFIFSDNADFKALNEINRVSIVVEDLLTSICIQCSDLICHLLLLYSDNQEQFKTNLDHCIDETLRLYPLTDIWVRKAQDQQRAWIASLTLLNRSGWSEPDRFNPERWKQEGHPPLISWGFDARGCPATKVGYNLVKMIMQKMMNENVWVQPASNFVHERTFIEGCQVWIGKGEKPSSWKYKRKWKKQLQFWLNSRLRIIDQKELW